MSKSLPSEFLEFTLAMLNYLQVQNYLIILFSLFAHGNASALRQYAALRLENPINKVKFD